jgi:membrane-associated phospholipid phosphatase
VTRTELDLLLAVQRRTPPAALPLARGLSSAGEHAAAWLAIGLAGVALDPGRRPAWARATGTVFVAHAVSVVVKRLARRVRPVHDALLIGVGVPSRWSFPSSHATSTTAAALAYGGVLGSRLPLVVVPAMAWSRLALGVHYPSDVAAGSLLGAAVAVAGRR